MAGEAIDARQSVAAVATLRIDLRMVFSSCGVARGRRATVDAGGRRVPTEE
jgi:hypothetical protein